MSEPVFNPSPTPRRRWRLLFLAVFLTANSVLSLLSAGLQIAAIWNVQIVAHWPATPATIHDSRVATQPQTDRDGKTTYHNTPIFTFSYSVRSAEYIAHAYQPWGGDSTAHAGNPMSLDCFTPGKTVPVFYNPDDPAEAYLAADVASATWWQLLLSLIFALLFAIAAKMAYKESHIRLRLS